MSEQSPPEAPELGLFVTTEQRERGQGLLAEAYADGRLTESEFDQRLDQVLLARTRRDLNTAFYGLIDPTGSDRPPAVHSGQGSVGERARRAAAWVHLSGLPT